MANLILPDTFEPYYAGREDEAERRAKPPRQSKKQQSKTQPERQADGEIILPQAAPAPEGVTRRDRRPTAH
jgi:hypothetical protein